MPKLKLKLKKLPKKPKAKASTSAMVNYLSKVGTIKKENEKKMKEHNSAVALRNQLAKKIAAVSSKQRV